MVGIIALSKISCHNHYALSCHLDLSNRVIHAVSINKLLLCDNLVLTKGFDELFLQVVSSFQVLLIVDIRINPNDLGHTVPEVNFQRIVPLLVDSVTSALFVTELLSVLILNVLLVCVLVRVVNMLLDDCLLVSQPIVLQLRVGPRSLNITWVHIWTSTVIFG